ncbi:Ig-like domain-containing protein [Rhodohalobacter sp. 8-1]|uniref:Ig-like domain-containing protein n=1 Tax=Rhodohalobacter sp. 8-1 TaxID=3131972 RepID=UPI0030EEE477
MNASRTVLLSFSFFCLWLGSCATPVAPTGGPPDRTPPEIINTYPEVGATNFTGDEVRFEFSEFPDRNSVRDNVTIEPNIGIQYEVDFSRKTAIVEFANELPENTTILVKLGSDVSDTRNNTMGSSFDLAFSTGPVIDDGQITGRLRDADLSSVEAGERVFLFRTPVDFTAQANYVAQSDTSGQINFSYLREGTYSAIWVDDLNRDRRWNPERERAQPFHSETVDVLQSKVTNIGTIYIQRPDTVSPRLDGVGLLSDVRLRLRLSEEVTWSEDAELAILDSLGDNYTTAYPLYKDLSDPNILYSQAVDPLEESQLFDLRQTGFTDEAGNSLRTDIDLFPGSAVSDTTQLRIISDNADGGLYPDEPFEIVYSKFIENPAVLDSLIVFEGENAMVEYEFTEVDRNRLRILPDGEWKAGVRYQFGVWDPDLLERRTFQPEIWQRNQLGNIDFIPADDDTVTQTHLMLSDENNKVSIDTVYVGFIEITDIPPVEYTAKIYRNTDDIVPWSPGTVIPFQAPEPYFLRRDIPVREGFTSEVNVEFSGTQAGPPESAPADTLTRED